MTGYQCLTLTLHALTLSVAVAPVRPAVLSPWPCTRTPASSPSAELPADPCTSPAEQWKFYHAAIHHTVVVDISTFVLSKMYVFVNAFYHLISDVLP